MSRRMSRPRIDASTWKTNRLIFYNPYMLHTRCANIPLFWAGSCCYRSNYGKDTWKHKSNMITIAFSFTHVALMKTWLLLTPTIQKVKYSILPRLEICAWIQLSMHLLSAGGWKVKFHIGLPHIIPLHPCRDFLMVVGYDKCLHSIYWKFQFWIT